MTGKGGSNVKMTMRCYKILLFTILPFFTISIVLFCEQKNYLYQPTLKFSQVVKHDSHRTPGDSYTDKQWQTAEPYNISQFYKVWREYPTLKSNDSLQIKKIVLWTGIFGKNLSERMSCKPMKTCIFTGDRTQVNDADAVVFHFWDTPMVYNKFFMPSVRHPHQYWVWYAKECPENNRYVDLSSYSGVYNWTMTYRNDSDVKRPLGSLYQVYKNLHQGKLISNSTKKTHLVAWFVSKCYKYFPRHIYATELAKYLPIDVYGKCGKEVCKKPNNKCLFKVIRQYKFYLAFESYRCKEYITEKFWHNALDQGVVPIVLGPPRSDYEKFAPSNSFIHVDDFESPKALARYIKILDEDDAKYNQYFNWRTTPLKNVPKFIFGACGLCAKLHEVDPSEKKVYTDLEKWWKGRNYEFCQPLVLTDNVWDKKDLVYYA